MTPESLEKGLKNLVMAAGLTAGSMSSPITQHLNSIPYNETRSASPSIKTPSQHFTGAQLGTNAGNLLEGRPSQPSFDKQTTLKAIAQQESNGGKNTNHRVLKGTMNRGTHAYGKYGLVDSTIKEVVKKSPELKHMHAAIQTMTPDQVHEYLDKTPGLEDQIASNYHDHIAKALGTNHPAAVYVGWLNGIAGAKKYLQNKDPSQHEHAAKVFSYYKHFASSKK